MRQVVAAATLALMSAVAPAETIRFEAYRLLVNGERQLVARGSREYSPTKDIQLVDPCGCGSSNERHRRLALFGAYGIEVGAASDDPSEGFGLVVTEAGNRNSFSWNWFSPPDRVPHWLAFLVGAREEQPDIFVRRSQDSRVRLVTRNVNGTAHFEAIEFLDDVTLQFTDDMMRRPVGVDTHEIVVLKGSVFRVLEGAP